MPFIKLIQRTVLISCLFSVTALKADDQTDTAITEPVTALHNVLLENMKQGDSASFEERYLELENIIQSRFDTPLIAKVILGRYWQTLDEQAQQDFIELFNELTIATYANRFNSYANEQFNTVGVDAMRKQRYLVKTELLRQNDEPVSLDYIVQQDGETWKIISVIANGVNDLSLKRVEYGSVIKDHGYDALIGEIKVKIADLKN